MNKLAVFTLALCFASCYANMDVRIVVNNNSKVPLLAVDAWGGRKLLFPGEKQQFVNGETTTVDVFRLCPTKSDTQHTPVCEQQPCWCTCHP